MHTRSTSRQLRGGRLVKRDSLVKVKQAKAAKKELPKEKPKKEPNEEPNEEPKEQPKQEHKKPEPHLLYLHFLRQMDIGKLQKNKYDCTALKQTRAVIKANLLQLFDVLNACSLLRLTNNDDRMLHERK